jgi:hypothetical protein
MAESAGEARARASGCTGAPDATDQNAMSRRALTLTLWLLFLCTLPLPYFMIETGRVPAVLLMVLAVLTAPLAFTDPGLTTRVVAGLFALQSLLYGALLFVAARWAARRLEHALPPRRRVLAVAVLVLVLAGGGVAFDLYRSPLSHGPGRTNLLGVFR